MSSVLNVKKTGLASVGETHSLLATGSCATFALRPLSLRRNFSWTFAGNIIYAGCQWGVLMVLARLGGPEMVGRFVLGLAITSPVFMLGNLHLRAVQATDFTDTFVFTHYLLLRLITTVLCLVAVVGIGAVGQFSRQTLGVILVIGLSKGIDAVSDVFYGLFQRYERMDLIAKATMLNGILSLLLLATGVLLTGGDLWGAVGYAIASALALALCIVPGALSLLGEIGHAKEGRDPAGRNRGVGRWRLPGRTLLRLTRLSLPMGVVMMLNTLGVNLPSYFIEGTRGERELGLFAGVAYLMVLCNTIVTALGQSATPRLANYYHSGEVHAFVRVLSWMLAVGFLLGTAGGLVASAAGGPVLRLVYGEDYSSLGRPFVILMIASLANYLGSFLGTAVTAMRRFDVQVPIHFATVILGAIGYWVLVPSNGISGAAWVVLGTAWFATLAYGFVTVRSLYALSVVRAPGESRQ